MSLASTKPKAARRGWACHAARRARFGWCEHGAAIQHDSWLETHAPNKHSWHIETTNNSWQTNAKNATTNVSLNGGKAETLKLLASNARDHLRTQPGRPEALRRAQSIVSRHPKTLHERSLHRMTSNGPNPCKVHAVGSLCLKSPISLRQSTIGGHARNIQEPKPHKVRAMGLLASRNHQSPGADREWLPHDIRMGNR